MIQLIYSHPQVELTYILLLANRGSLSKSSKGSTNYILIHCGKECLFASQAH